MAKATVFEAMNNPSCGLDVHKDKIEACVINEAGEKQRKTFGTMRQSLYALKDWILSHNCFHVLMESTSVFWIPIYEILEEAKGMDVGLGNSGKMKQVPGRPKTDKEDADWIARLCMVGFIIKSFVAGREYRELREYTRYHKKLVQERARQINRIEKLLQMNGFKLSSVLSDITGASGMKLLKKLSSKGSVALSEVQEALHWGVKKSAQEIEAAINGQIKRTSRLLLGKMLSKLERCDTETDEIYKMMVEMSQPSRSQIDLIEKIREGGEVYNDFYEYLHKIDKPSLFLVGNYDAFMCECDCFLKNTPKGSIVVFKNSGHFPHIEEPQAFKEAVIDFMDNLAV